MRIAHREQCGIAQPQPSLRLEDSDDRKGHPDVLPGSRRLMLFARYPFFEIGYRPNNVTSACIACETILDRQGALGYTQSRSVH